MDTSRYSKSCDAMLPLEILTVILEMLGCYGHSHLQSYKSTTVSGFCNVTKYKTCFIKVQVHIPVHMYLQLTSLSTI